MRTERNAYLYSYVRPSNLIFCAKSHNLERTLVSRNIFSRNLEYYRILLDLKKKILIDMFNNVKSVKCTLEPYSSFWFNLKVFEMWCEENVRVNKNMHLIVHVSKQRCFSGKQGRSYGGESIPPVVRVSWRNRIWKKFA